MYYSIKIYTPRRRYPTYPLARFWNGSTFVKEHVEYSGDVETARKHLKEVHKVHPKAVSTVYVGPKAIAELGPARREG